MDAWEKSQNKDTKSLVYSVNTIGIGVFFEAWEVHTFR